MAPVCHQRANRGSGTGHARCSSGTWPRTGTSPRWIDGSDEGDHSESCRAAEPAPADSPAPAPQGPRLHGLHASLLALGSTAIGRNPPADCARRCPIAIAQQGGLRYLDSWRCPISPSKLWQIPWQLKWDCVSGCSFSRGSGQRVLLTLRCFGCTRGPHRDAQTRCNSRFLANQQAENMVLEAYHWPGTPRQSSCLGNSPHTHSGSFW
ncbi:hypothetical protein VTI74DRAFT_8676 [Chaetomium olivicolor]